MSIMSVKNVLELVVPPHLKDFWLDVLLEYESQILELESFNFGKFPDGTANRLDKFNFFSLRDDFVKDTIEMLIQAIDRNLSQSYSGLYYGTAWANILKTGQSMGVHNHKDDPSRMYSGVFYLNESNTKIHFFDQNGVRVNSVRPEPGRLILFPSEFDHSVEENEEDFDRVSLVFDIAIEKPSELWVQLN